VTERLHDLAERQQHPWGTVTASRCRAVVRLASGRDRAGAAAAMVQAAAEYERLGLPFDRARTLLSLGRAQRRVKQWGAARSSLEMATTMFEQLGSNGWAEQARLELDRVGARRPSPTGELTATERRVADLAAAGSSNKEIARALYVTVHTVEAHLSHTYAKLGVRSRGQLAGRLSTRR
jgi:DNA-binding CsgD family transcriptional regulator